MRRLHTMVPFLCALTVCSGLAVGEDEEFRKVAAGIREKLVAALPEHWTACSLSRHRSPFGRRTTASDAIVYYIGLRYDLAPPPGPFSGPDQSWIVISPKKFRWQSKNDAPFSPLIAQEWNDGFLGSSEVADFFIGYPLDGKTYPGLTTEMVAKALGIHGKHSPVDLLQFELDQYIFRDALFKRIRERSEEDRLLFARWALDLLRDAGPFKFQRVFSVLPGVLLQQLPYHTVWPSTDEPAREERQKVLALWQAFVEWAGDKPEEEWMRSALRQNVELVAHENLWLAQDAVDFLEKITGREFGAVRLVPAEARRTVVSRWKDWLAENAERLRWDAGREQFLVPDARTE